MKEQTLEKRIAGSALTRFLQELFGNSAQFPIANLLFELLLEGPARYLTAPDAYAISLAALVQAHFLSRGRASGMRSFWGNLIGPALYTAIEFSIEGSVFFASPNHIAYWIYAAVIGALCASRAARPGTHNSFVQVVENIVRASILLTMYFIFEMAGRPDLTIANLFTDGSHRFIALATLLLGLSVGLADVTASRYLKLLRETTAQLRTYSEWLLGKELLARSLDDAQLLALHRHERTVLFMDIRGFTAWSESRSPETVVDLLNRYYRCAETVLLHAQVVKFKFSADEMMAVFADAAEGVRVAHELNREVSRMLSAEGLGAGIGVHTGPLVEGLLGSMGVKFYDVIGDTVNTAKRLESSAGPGEVLISAAVAERVPHAAKVGKPRLVAAKGKQLPIEVFPVVL
ncbi:MAG TPA: adenylate/guanylate cyclase domain-containing protein [Burkholderiales bacterium]|nr:adenylate/guanylate cyclase domain-containing protein [Burkholderiales bacterium]